MAKVTKGQKAQTPSDSDEALAFKGEEALARLKDFTRRIITVPKDEIAAKKRPKRKHA